jgi:hypothetical protein
MLIAFIVVSMLLGLFLSIVWNSTNLLNVVMKMVFWAYTLWAFLMLLAHLAPLINNGTLRLL